MSLCFSCGSDPHKMGCRRAIDKPRCERCQYTTKYVGKAPCGHCGGLGEPAIKIAVDWSLDFTDSQPPPKIVFIPVEVYDNAMTNTDMDWDDVSEWLTDNYDFLVENWRLVNNSPNQ